MDARLGLLIEPDFSRFYSGWDKAEAKTKSGLGNIEKAHQQSQQKIKGYYDQYRAGMLESVPEIAQLQIQWSGKTTKELVDHIHQLSKQRADEDLRLRKATAENDTVQQRIHKNNIERIQIESKQLRLLASEREEVRKKGAGSLIGMLGTGRGITDLIPGGQYLSELASAGSVVGKFSVVLTAAAFGLREVIKVGAPFETAMTNISARTGLAGTSLQSLQTDVLKFSDTFHEAAPQAADAFKDVIAAFGPNIANDTKTVNSLANNMGLLTKAMGSDGDLPTSISLVSTLMNQFGLNVGTGSQKAENAKRVIEVLASASKQSGTDIKGMATAMGSAGEIAHQYGLTLEETTGAILLLQKNGLEGGTQFRQFIENISTGTPEAEKALGRLGLKYYEINPEIVGVNKSLEILKSRIEQVKDPVERHNILQEIFSKRSVVAAEALLQQSDKFKELTASVTAQNTVTEMANKNLNTLSEQWKGVTIQAETFGIKLYGKITPALKEFIGFARSTVHELEGIYNFMESIIGTAASSGPVIANQLQKANAVFAASQHQRVVDFASIGSGSSFITTPQNFTAPIVDTTPAEKLAAAKKDQAKKDADERAKAGREAESKATAARREAYAKEQDDLREKNANALAEYIKSKHSEEEVQKFQLLQNVAYYTQLFDSAQKYKQKIGEVNLELQRSKIELAKFTVEQTKKSLEQETEFIKQFATQGYDFQKQSYQARLTELDHNLKTQIFTQDEYDKKVLELNIQSAKEQLEVTSTFLYLGVDDLKAVQDAKEKLRKAELALVEKDLNERTKLQKQHDKDVLDATKKQEQTTREFIQVGLQPITSELDKQIDRWGKLGTVTSQILSDLTKKLLGLGENKAIDALMGEIFPDDTKKKPNTDLSKLPHGASGMDTDNPNGEIIKVGTGFLAVLHPGELVVPKTQLPLMGGGVGPATFQPGEGGGNAPISVPATPLHVRSLKEILGVDTPAVVDSTDQKIIHPTRNKKKAGDLSLDPEDVSIAQSRAGNYLNANAPSHADALINVEHQASMEQVDNILKQPKLDIKAIALNTTGAVVGAGVMIIAPELVAEFLKDFAAGSAAEGIVGGSAGQIAIKGATQVGMSQIIGAAPEGDIKNTLETTHTALEVSNVGASFLQHGLMSIHTITEAGLAAFNRFSPKLLAPQEEGEDSGGTNNMAETKSRANDDAITETVELSKSAKKASTTLSDLQVGASAATTGLGALTQLPGLSSLLGGSNSPVSSILSSVSSLLPLLAMFRYGGVTRAAYGTVSHNNYSSLNDTIPILTAPGEGIIRASSVQHYGGRAFVDALNTRTFTPTVHAQSPSLDMSPLLDRLDMINGTFNKRTPPVILDQDRQRLSAVRSLRNERYASA